MTKIRLWCLKHKNIIPNIIVLFMLLSMLPAIFIKIEIADIDPFYIPNIVALSIITLLALLIMKLLYPKWNYGFNKNGFKDGVQNYGIIVLIAFIVRLISIYFDFKPFDHTPSIQKIIIEYFIYLICIGFYEEILWRGIFLNTLKDIFAKNRHNALIAVVISSIGFALVHIVVEIGQPVYFIIMKVLYCLGFGIFLGAVYTRTKNIWLAIIIHDILNFAMLPPYFSNTQSNADITLITTVIMYSLMGVYGIMIMVKDDGLAK